MNKLSPALALLLLLPACSRHNPQPQTPVAGSAEVRTPPVPTSRRPTVDPKSTEAAVDLVRAFAAMLNDRQFNEAYMLLGAKAPLRTNFDDNFSKFSDLRVTLGTAGLQEGAAGSTYVSVPLTVDGRNDNRDISRKATAVVRRVNDVPGSTEEERHWHIDRIDWQNQD